MQFGNYRIQVKTDLKEDSLLNLIYKYIVELIAETCQEYMYSVAYDEIFIENEKYAKIMKAENIFVMDIKSFRNVFFTKFPQYAENVVEKVNLLGGKINQQYSNEKNLLSNITQSTTLQLEKWFESHFTLADIYDAYNQYIEKQKKILLVERNVEESSLELALLIFPIEKYLQNDDYFLENGQQIVGSNIDISSKIEKAKSFIQKQLPQLTQTIDTQTQSNPWFIVLGIFILFFVFGLFIFIFYFIFIQ